MTTDTRAAPPRRDDPLGVDCEVLRSLIHGSMSGEFATARGDKPATYPLTPFYDDDRGTIILTSPVAFSRKAATIRTNPRVGLLLHDASGEYLVTGDATIDDAVGSNATYVRELNDREPETPKRRANQEKYDFVATRRGRLLAGWLSDRIVIEIEPRWMGRIAETARLLDLEVWSAAGIDAAEARQYERGVLTTVDAAGYPWIQPVSFITIEDGAAVVDPMPTVQVADGQPACILLHWHDEASIKLRQRLVRGRFRTIDDRLAFVPASSTTLQNDGLIDTIRFLIEGHRKTRAYFEGRTPPGPAGLPVVGNTVQFLRDPVRFYNELSAYGDVVRYSVGGNTWTAMVHPDDIERVLVRDSHRFERYTFEDLGFDFLPEGLFFSTGEPWRQQRRAIQPAFSPGNLQPFAQPMTEAVAGTVSTWGDGVVINANEVFSDLTLEVLSTTLFDIDLDDRHAVVTDAAESLSKRVDTGSLSAVVPGWIPTRRNRDFARKMAAFDRMVAALIEERRHDDTPRDDLLSTLLDASEDEQGEVDDYRFTDKGLRDQLVTLLFAGHETTALVFTWAFHLLAQHDEVRRRLETEIETVCGDRLPTVDDVPDLDYTEQVIKETMRCYPPVYVLFREVLEDVSFGDSLVQAGTNIVLPPYLVHRDERWWDDPTAFQPERWTDDLEDDLPEYAYFPFGGGPRHCVGMRFAMLFLTLGIATVVQRASFDLVSDPTPSLHMAATLSPADDVMLRVNRRTRP